MHEVKSKKLILIYGMSCAGKTTVLNTLYKVNTSSMHLIPQTTSRSFRSGDCQDHFHFIQKMTQEDMFLYNDECTYGLSYQDLTRFQKSAKDYGITICGFKEVQQAYQKLPVSNLVSIRVTFSDNREEELEVMRQTLPMYFSTAEANRRLNFVRLTYFDLLQTPYSLSLTRKMSMEEWSQRLATITDSPPEAILSYLQNRVCHRSL